MIYYYILWWVISRGLVAVACMLAHGRATNTSTGSGFTRSQILVINNLCYTVVVGDVLCLIILVLSLLRMRDLYKAWWAERVRMAGTGLRNYPR